MEEFWNEMETRISWRRRPKKSYYFAYLKKAKLQKDCISSRKFCKKAQSQKDFSVTKRFAWLHTRFSDVERFSLTEFFGYRNIFTKQILYLNRNIFCLWHKYFPLKKDEVMIINFHLWEYLSIFSSLLYQKF